MAWHVSVYAHINILTGVCMCVVKRRAPGAGRYRVRTDLCYVPDLNVLRSMTLLSAGPILPRQLSLRHTIPVAREPIGENSFQKMYSFAY